MLYKAELCAYGKCMTTSGYAVFGTQDDVRVEAGTYGTKRDARTVLADLRRQGYADVAIWNLTTGEVSK